MPDRLPLPPFDLRQRVGAVTFPGHPDIEATVRKAAWWDPDPAVSWLNQGSRLADTIEAEVPLDLGGARILDFGCGAGRVLRHLIGRAGELHGVDLDAESVDWLNANLGEHLTAALTSDEPALPYPDDHFDVVYAYSVFTHLTDHWAGWLLELHRVLRPGGVLFASVLGAETAAELGVTSPGGETAGIAFHALGNGWDHGGPVTVHEPGWIAEHWGRAFTIVSHTPRTTDAPWPHDIVVGQALETAPDELGLLAPGPDGRAEGRDRRTQLAVMVHDARSRREHDEATGGYLAAQASRRRAALGPLATARLAELEDEAARLRQERAEMLASRSLRISRPLRALGDRRW